VLSKLYGIFLVAVATTQGNDLIKNQISKRTFLGNKIKNCKEDFACSIGIFFFAKRLASLEIELSAEPEMQGKKLLS
jgi:hypothetical protein